MSQSIPSKLWKQIAKHGRGYVFTPPEVLHLGPRTAVDQALSRLVKSGKLKRLAHGVYAYPEMNQLVGEVPPSPAAIAQALARGRGAEAQVSEAAAANSFGLTTQVPGRVVYLTNGAPRHRRVGNITIEFRRASPRRLAGAGSPAGAVVQALRYLGPASTSSQVVEKVRHGLSRGERQKLRHLLPMTPEWMRPAIQAISETTNG